MNIWEKFKRATKMSSTNAYFQDSMQGRKVCKGWQQKIVQWELLFVRQWVCQKILAFWLSRYFNIIVLSTVKNILKIIRTFDGKSMSKPKPKVSKLTTDVKNVKNIPEFLTYVKKLLTQNSLFWTVKKSIFENPFDSQKIPGFLTFFDKGGIILQKSTKVLNCYWNAQP